MDLLWIAIIILVVLFMIVMYQSRVDRPTLDVYVSRFFRLIVIIMVYLKDVSLCAATKFREVNWDTTGTNL